MLHEITAKAEGLSAVPEAVLTRTGPVVEEAGTRAEISEGETTVYDALTPLNWTPVTFVNPLPWMET